MSCEDCDTKTGIIESAVYSMPLSYVRVGNGNVLIVGCDKHLRQMLEILWIERRVDPDIT